MKAEHINPFIMSTYQVFESMLNCKVKAGEIRAGGGEKETRDIIGIIGLSGTAQGTVALRFPVMTALSIVGEMVGDKIRSVDASVVDGIGEIVNIIAGKSKLHMGGHKLSISLPTVVRGSMYKNSGPGHLEWFEVPFTCSLGEFSLAVTFKLTPSKTEEAVRESTGC